MHRYRNLMINITSPADEQGLIEYAGRVAKLGTAAQVHFIHVLRTPDHNRVLNHDREKADLQTAIQSQLAGISPQVKIVFDVLHGSVIDQLLVYAADHQIDLLITGDEIRGARRRTLARRLAMKAPCSVWVVPQGPRATLRRILVPVDFSEHAADSMRVAVSMARLARNAECIALHVYFNEAVSIYEEYDQVLRGREEDTFRRFMGPIDCQGVTVSPIYEESANVPHAIIRVAAAQQADLVVMATRGRSRSAAILLGSVTEEIIAECPVPVLAVKHFGARLGVLQALLDRTFHGPSTLQFD